MMERAINIFIGKRTLVLTILLSFLLVAMADDGIRMRSCRPMKMQRTEPVMRSAMRTTTENPYIGNRRQLVIMVSFANQDFLTDGETATLEKWNNIFNTVGYNQGDYVGSVHDYFYAQSYEQLNLTFDLYYIPLSENREKYKSTDEDDENSQFLVNDIIDVLATKGIDWSLYDWDGNGEVNQLIIVYAGKGMNAGGGSNTIWPHQWWLSKHKNCSARTVTSGAKSYKIDCYCCVQEEIKTSSIQSSFGTICHEYSHCFGLPDFYVGSTKYVAEWDLMDYGNNNGKGFHPCGYSAHERMLLGWLMPTELTTTTTITSLPPLSDEPQAYLIRNDGYANEYYMVENRQKTGWDASLPGSGIVVFHIDYDKEVWDEGLPNEDSPRRYTIIPANNKNSSYYQSNWAYPYADNNSISNESTPIDTVYHTNTDGRKYMNKPLTNLDVTGGIASFDYTNNTTAITEKRIIGEPKILFDLGPIYIIRNEKGEIKKVMKH